MTQGQRRAETRAALLEAAAELFAEHGYDAVSVDTVAAAAGRTSGAVYDHFASKQGLLMAVLDEGAQALVGLMTDEFDTTRDLRARLRAVAANVVVRPTEDTRRLMLLERELELRAARDPAVARALLPRARRAQRRLARGLTRWKAEGLLPPGARSPEEIAHALRAVVAGMELSQRLDPSAFDVEGAADVLEAVLWRRARA